MTIDLSGMQPFRIGRNRVCYLHPDDPSKCIKIRSQSADPKPRKLANRLHHRIIDLTGWLDFNSAEMRNYCLVKESLRGHLPEYFGIQPTNLGPGLVVELVRDHDGQQSVALAEHIGRHGKIADPDLWRRFESLFERLRAHDVLLYDLNLLNIILRQDEAGVVTPVIVDLKSLNSRRTLLQLAGWSKAEARRKLDRRIRQLTQRASAFA
ncbi:YrbL family protein [Rhodospirillaceae bacterium SYSU D60014]|uniref:YrbL family protein n=1 Tax=Virgifigura deserti TaxID=2268457 RepID=UPI0013C4D444